MQQGHDEVPFQRLSRNAGWALNFCNMMESMEKLTFSWSLDVDARNPNAARP